MELPIQLKFFRKLELYQELKDENQKAKEAGGTKKETWVMEKLVLSFADKEHHHRGSILKNVDIQDKIQRKNFSKESIENELGHIAKNLISRDFAKFASKDEDINKGFFITKEGFLMGKVINEVESGKKKMMYFYEFLYILVWASAISGALYIIVKLIEFFVNFLYRIKHLI